MTSRNPFPFVPRPIALVAVGRGSFRTVAAALVSLVMLMGTVACGPTPAPASPGPALPEIPLEAGDPSGSESREAAETTARAEAALEAGRWQEAAAIATDVIETWPATGSAGLALWVRARALGRIEAGGEQATALSDVERLIPLLEEGGERRVTAELLAARLLAERGDRVEGLRRALSIPANASVTTGDLTWARQLAAELDASELQEVVEGVAPGQPLAAPVFVGLGRALGDQGRPEAARAAAQAALDGGAIGTDREAAEALLAGVGIAEDPTMADRIPLAAILPQSGSPALQRFSTGVAEGIQAAIQAARMEDRAAVEVYDDAGDPAAAASLIRTAEGAGVFGVVGPVQEGALTAVVAARDRAVPIISPSAYSVPAGSPAVYSLASLDPAAATELAGWAADVGIGSVAIIHAAEQRSSEEARIFEEAFAAQGGTVVGRETYVPGATFFEEQILGAVAARPDALLLPVPASDVEALAPQVIFFGVDTLGIQILGTAGWTDDDVRESVAARNLSGVVAASPDLTESEGRDRFVRAYEERFRRTLRDDGSVALGYDAAALLLEAARSGARSPAELASALESIEDFAGATGRLSVEDGRIVRAHRVVCYSGSELVPIGAERPIQLFRPRPATDSVPPGPGRRDGFACPGTPQAIRADSLAGYMPRDTLRPTPASPPLPVAHR